MCRVVRKNNKNSWRAARLRIGGLRPNRWGERAGRSDPREQFGIMLKSQSTQLACTLLFGPLGLAYISMASAVMLTLLTIVLYFTMLGPVAVVGMWPVAMVIGGLAVHLHNVQMRNVGLNLLLTDDRRSEELTQLLSAGARFAAIVLFIGGAVFGVVRYGSTAKDKAVDSVADLAEQTGINELINGVSTETLASAGDLESAPLEYREPASAAPQAPRPQPVEASVEVATGGVVTQVPATAIPLDEREVVLLPASSPAPKSTLRRSLRKLPSDPLVKVKRRDRVVGQAIANLRSGPGTGHSIVDIARKGDRLVQLARQGNWVQVQLADSERIAWIFGGLLKR